MPRPKSVRVGCLTYEIITDPERVREVSGQQDIEAGSEWAVFSDHDALVIGIRGDLPEFNQRRDVLHELLHCALRYAGVEPNQYARIVARAKHKHGGYSVEEFTVAAISGPLLSVLRDNPPLLAWLVEG